MFWPLAGQTDANPLEGGYGYLDKTDGGATFHPGIDCNSGTSADADCGADVRTPEAGTVRYVGQTAPGYGLHAWIQTDSGKWLHFCHLSAARGADGDRVARQQVIGSCGKSGGQVYCHTHFEVRSSAPPTWDYWPYGVPVANVIQQYQDPENYLAWADAQPPAQDTAPETGEEPAAVNADDQAIVDAVRGLNGDAASVDGWISEIGALKQDNARLTEQLNDLVNQSQGAVPVGYPLDKVILHYTDGHTQEVSL